ncbi:MAG TPA: hypothetical protein VL854_00075 [Nitrososphaeraceae archaeon]|nr:hypothetical protein [Nitrososphaeraceae archaeon]
MSTKNRIVSIVEDDSSNVLFFHEALKGLSMNQSKVKAKAKARALLVARTRLAVEQSQD